MKKIATVIFLSAVILLNAQQQSAAETEPHVNAYIEYLHDDVKIRFSLENKSNESVSVFNVPWKSWVPDFYVSILSLDDESTFDPQYWMKTSGSSNSVKHQRLDQFYFVNQFVEIPAHGKIEGTIDLLKRFPILRSVLAEHDVELFWVYQMRVCLTKDRGSLAKRPSIGGYFHLEKSEPHKK